MITQKTKSLFLFAGYDANSVLDDALIFYIHELSKFGDVILCMDSDCAASELAKITKYTIHSIGKRHGEYDFGSYKRAFEYAKKHNILKNYDFVYLVNDSVYGPLFDISDILNKIQKSKTDATGMVVSYHKTHSYMESWFVCLTSKIFLSDWFDKFMSEITKQPTKSQVTIKYEHGLSNLIQNNNCTWSGVFLFHGRFTYSNPKYLFKHGCPFVKKASFIRHYGEHGKQLKYILNHCDKKSHKPIVNAATRIYGKQYMDWLLTYNPFKIFIRKIKYAWYKIKGKIL